MRVLFFGTSEFAAPHLERVAAGGHQVLRCITQPDQPQGRGLRSRPSPVKLAAQRLGIPVDEPADLRAAAQAYAALAPAAGIVIAYGRLIPRELLALPKQGMLGVHPSLLPRYRGASPMVWALLDGVAETGVTVFRLNERMDAGEILLQHRAPVAERETIESLSARLIAAGAGLLVDGLDAMARGAAVFTPQDDAAATYTTKLTKAHGHIRWTDDAAAIDRQVRALNPWPGTSTDWQGQPLKIWSASPEPSSAGGRPGEIVRAAAEGIAVAAGRGVLVIRELQAPGGRRMSVREFLAGHPLRAGEQFGA